MEVSATSWAPPTHSLGLGRSGQVLRGSPPRPRGRSVGLAGSFPRGRGARNTWGHGYWVASHSGSRGGFKEARGRQRETLSGAAGLCLGGGWEVGESGRGAGALAVAG